MAEKNDFDDEYEFVEQDYPGTPLAEEPEPLAKEPAYAVDAVPGNNIRRNALIVVGLIILLFLIYEFLIPLFSGPAKPVSTGVITPPAIIEPAVQPPSQAELPVQPVQPVVTASPVDSTAVEKKLASMDLVQQNIREDIASLSAQISSMNSNISQLASKIDGLTQNLNVLSSKVEQQNNQIALLIASKKTPAKPRPAAKRVIKPSAVYYIQAVIPGRAWLISSNGSTITVREGTNLPGYGVVKLIDPGQGRVLTSSGRVIRFSQQDN